MRSRFTMTSSYESYSRAGADEPDVGIPNILKRILRISLPARAVNRGPALFGRITGNPEVISSPVGLVPTNALLVRKSSTE
jgi:hypothetical protein